MTSDKHIFISYARRDGSDVSARLARDLERAGFQVWRDSRDIHRAQDFTSQIENGIELASYVVACITDDTRRDDSFVRREISYADLIDRPILVARFQAVPPPVSIATNTFIEFFAGWEAAFAELCRALKTPIPARRARARSVDPHYDYVSALYRDIVRYLDQTVFSLIPLRSTSSGDAVERTVSSLPMAFLKRALVHRQPRDEPAETFDGLAEPFEEFGGRMLVLGEAGAGKTTALFALARDAVAHRLEDPSQPLPVLAPIAEWRSERESGSLSDWLVTLLPVVDPVELRQIIESGRALLLLDGLDEIARPGRETGDSAVGAQSEDPRLQFLKQLSPRGRIVLTSRVADYQSLDEKARRLDVKVPVGGAVELQPLDDAQLKVYLQKFPVLWQALERDAELHGLARNPLLLSILTFAFAGMKEEAGALVGLSRESLRDRIFDTYVSRRYEHESLKHQLLFTLEELYRALGEVATAEVLSGSDALSRVINDLEGTNAEEFIRQAIRLNLLVRGLHGRLQFVHLLLRDHFAARLNRDRLKEDDPRNFDRAVFALGRIGDEATMPTLVGFLETPARQRDLWAESRRATVVEALWDAPVAAQSQIARLLIEASFDRKTLSLEQTEAFLNHFDVWQVGHALDAAARAGSIERRKRVIDFIRDFRNHITTNVLPGLFEDPDVGEYAVNAVGTMTGSAANMALDRWEEYQRGRES